jgi:hypothetical protein
MSSRSNYRAEALDVWTLQVMAGSQPQRMLFCLPHKNLCRCGCKGSCTTTPLENLLVWSLRHCALGLHPRLQPDGTP